jgi:hypothetical protein
VLGLQVWVGGHWSAGEGAQALPVHFSRAPLLPMQRKPPVHCTQVPAAPMQNGAAGGQLLVAQSPPEHCSRPPGAGAAHRAMFPVHWPVQTPAPLQVKPAAQAVVGTHLFPMHRWRPLPTPEQSSPFPVHSTHAPAFPVQMGVVPGQAAASIHAPPLHCWRVPVIPSGLQRNPSPVQATHIPWSPVQTGVAAGQAAPALHMPLMHCWRSLVAAVPVLQRKSAPLQTAQALLLQPRAHALLQPPQWSLLVLGSTQAPPQQVLPPVQAAPLLFMEQTPVRGSQVRQGPSQLAQTLGGTQVPPLQMLAPQALRSALTLQLRLSAVQARQGPSQLVALHTPVQTPFMHWAVLPVHLRASQVGLHWPPSQAPFTQGVFAAAATQVSITQTWQGPGQLAAVHFGGSGIWQRPSRHSGVVPPQVWATGAQAPRALHEGTDTVLPLQLAAPQGVPTASRWQSPAPLQPLEQASFAHVPEGSAPPTGTLLHWPSSPGRLHDWQAPLQAPAQQRPCAQTLLPQSAALLQAAPTSRKPHDPPPHTPVAHSESLLHRLAQAPLLQPRKGAQLRAGGALQVPA